MASSVTAPDKEPDPTSEKIEERTGLRSTDDMNSFARRTRALRARLRSRGLDLESLDSVAPENVRPLTSRATDRLRAFSTGQIGGVKDTLGIIKYAPWPSLEGCLGVLFTSRTGSSYLARELAPRFAIGRMEESLNPPVVQGIAAGNIVRSYAGRWFGFKQGVPGTISAELIGAMDEYIDKTFFILLLRRDIVAQAVSLVKAKQTGRWHSTREAKSSAHYNAVEIANAVRVIAGAVVSLKAYLDRTGRPWRRVFYEDFEHGDFATVESICEAFGMPRLPPGEGPTLEALERTSDAVNDAWRESFGGDCDIKTRACIENYLSEIINTP